MRCTASAPAAPDILWAARIPVWAWDAGHIPGCNQCRRAGSSGHRKPEV